MWLVAACYYLLGALPIFGVPVEGRITCLDNDGKFVDWFILYKLPIHYNLDSKSRKFPPHLYMDANLPKFQMVSQTLKETNQSVSFTLQQAYKNRKSGEVGYIFYNDEKPMEAGGAVTSSHGHTKGVTVFDRTSGFWLVHSVPKYPPPTNSSYTYPHSAVRYAQHLLCISLNSTLDVQTLSEQLKMNEPWVYDSNLPTFVKYLYPVMFDVVNKVKPLNILQVSTITSYAGRVFISFAKSAKFQNDLYSKLVAPTLKCNMSVETWRHGSKSADLPSYCENFETENVEVILNKQLDISFRYTLDHSKYAVCQDNWQTKIAASYVCIGDINRQRPQEKRGGGTVCFLDTEINKQYQSFIHQLEKCPAV